jgi:hypothetical protein
VKPGGLILLSEPNRYIAEPFIESLKESGFGLQKYIYDVRIKSIGSKISVYAISIGPDS